MMHFLSIILSLLIASTPLSKLWQEYQKAAEKDLPQKQLSILQSIKDEALRTNKHWDYYDAAAKATELQIRLNYKLQDSLRQAFRQDIIDKGESVAIYYMRRGEHKDSLLEFITQNEKSLRRSSTPDFWERDWRLSNYKFSAALKALLKNDFDYCLWSLFPKQEILSHYKSYPLEAFVAYENLDKTNAEQLQTFANKYKDKAVALLAKEDLLSLKFYKFEKENAKSEDYLVLKKECEDFLTQAKLFKGSEKEIASQCKLTEQLLAQMEAKHLNMWVDNSLLYVSLRNIESARVQLRQEGKKLWETSLENKLASFYSPDTIKVPLPLLCDGTYSLKCFSSNVVDEVQWEKYTISTAIRCNSSGLGFWATDFLSGEPLEWVDLELLKDDKIIKTHKGIKVDGFTPIPEDIAKLLSSKNTYTLRVKQGERCSKPFWSITNDYSPTTNNAEKANCYIITDRAAFRPDETVHFKAILYRGNYNISVYPEAKVKFLLKDSKGEVLEEKSLCSNSYGSVAGSFVLERRDRNGIYSICAVFNGSTIGEKEVLVDDFVLPSFDLCFDPTPEYSSEVKEICVTGSVKAYSGHSLNGALVEYSVMHYGQEWEKGRINLNGEKFELCFNSDTTAQKRSWDHYSVKIKVTDVTGESMTFEHIVFVRPQNEKQIEFEHLFEDLSEGKIGVNVTSSTKRTYMVCELYGIGNILLDKALVEFEPKDGAFAQTTVSYPYLATYPDAVQLVLIYFENGTYYSHSVEKRRENHAYDLPLHFSRFRDTATPGASYSIGIQTLSGAEVVATVFDKSTERFMANEWHKLRPQSLPMPSVYFSANPGIDKAYSFRPAPLRFTRSSKANGIMEVSTLAMDSVQNTESIEEKKDEGNILIREDFATTLAWEPFLKADANGEAVLNFNTSDKLSTFYVQVFAHNRDMQNAIIRKEMVVTLPVKVSIAEPAFLYEGDKWQVRVGLSNNLSALVAGKVGVYFYNGGDYRSAEVLCNEEKRVEIEGKSSTNASFTFEAPKHVDTLGVKLVFTPDSILNASDAIFVKVPIKARRQSLTEAHSALLTETKDSASLESRLRQAFINVPADSAKVREISIASMLSEALPKVIKVRSENAIDLCNALYAASLCDSLGLQAEFNRSETTAKLLALQGSDGGFAWFKGMDSSPVITAVVLQRLGRQGSIDTKAAVNYLDKKWHPYLSLEEYLYTRSLFAEFPLLEKPDSRFCKEAKKYLVPTGARNLDALTLAKVRRALTLDNLASSNEGLTLAKRFGIKLFTASRLMRSAEADIASIADYCVRLDNGACYYPNAVMPFRGLLESELYAHSLICNLLEKHHHSDISNGIRLWMMLQKETQNWESDPGFIEALAAVSKAPKSILNTRVLTLSASFSKDFCDVAPVSNGMSISTLAPSSLTLGERIKITAQISNEHNRSFVHIVLPHSAGLVPVNQISGYKYGCYRSVMQDRIELWYEVFPEGKTRVSEEYYLTRSGEFALPWAEIECLYAPHYRANTAVSERQQIIDSSLN